jgi:FkbM family methyltransferase
MTLPLATIALVGRAALRGDAFELRRQWAYLRWRRDRGDATRKFDFPLADSAVVVDAGGYRGEWARGIAERFRCRIECCEPVPEFAAIARRTLAGFERATVHEIALGGRDTTLEFALLDDGTSAHRSGARTIRAQQRKASAWLDELGLDHVDLLKLNIEGAEFELLEELAGCGRFGSIDHLLVQFHDTVPDARARREALRARLARTHALVFDYPFVWERWSRLAAAR